MSARDSVKRIRDGADASVIMAEKLTATVVPRMGTDGGLSKVVMGNPEIDDFVVAQFRDPGDAESLAHELNCAVKRVIEYHSRAFLRTACDHANEALEALEQG